MLENGFYKVTQEFIELNRISSCFPIIEKYIEGEYTSKGQHLVLANRTEMGIIRRKLARIIFDENKNPNKYEQHITAIKEYLFKELNDLCDEKLTN